jgi:hypothetical protein
LIESHAGLARHGPEFNPAELGQLPDDIARELQHRCGDMLVRGVLSDRIAQGDNCFKVSDSDNTLRIGLRILPPVVSLPRSRPTAQPTRPRLIDRYRQYLQYYRLQPCSTSLILADFDLSFPYRRCPEHLKLLKRPWNARSTQSCDQPFSLRPVHMHGLLPCSCYRSMHVSITPLWMESVCNQSQMQIRRTMKVCTICSHRI